jgi:hypothetical protein
MDRHVQHSGELDVVDVVALALDEAGIFHPAPTVPETTDLGGCPWFVCGGGHQLAPSLVAAAAA